MKRYFEIIIKKRLNLGPLPLLDQLLIDHVVIEEEVVETFVKKIGKIEGKKYMETKDEKLLIMRIKPS